MAGRVAMNGFDLSPPQHLTHAVSMILGVCFMGVVLGLVIVGLFVRAVALSRAQDELQSFLRDGAKQPLRAGPRRVVHGRVETVRGGDTVPIEIDIEQRAVNRTGKSRKWHEWKESSRTVRATPFYLVRAGDDEPVYVEPNDDVLIIDRLSTLARDDTPGARVRRATVERDEVLYVMGNLHSANHPRALGGGYRGGVKGWVLRPPAGDRMLVATEAVSERYTSRIGFLRKAGAVFLFLYVVMHAAITLPFFAALVGGSHTEGVVTSTRSYLATGKHPAWHYLVSVRVPDGEVHELEVQSSVFGALREGERDGLRVPLLYTPAYPRATYLGDAPTLPFAAAWSCMIALFFLLVGGLMYHWRVPWYERRKVNEDGGEGHVFVP